MGFVWVFNSIPISGNEATKIATSPQEIQVLAGIAEQLINTSVAGGAADDLFEGGYTSAVATLGKKGQKAMGIEYDGTITPDVFFWPLRSTITLD